MTESRLILHFCNVSYLYLISILSVEEEPKLHDLLMLLCPIKYEWPIIGEQLGVAYDTIKSEDHNVAHDDVQRLNQILEYWINQKTSVVSWESILSIIVEPPIKEYDIVMNICDFLTKHYGDHEGILVVYLIIYSIFICC